MRFSLAQVMNRITDRKNIRKLNLEILLILFVNIICGIEVARVTAQPCGFGGRAVTPTTACDAIWTDTLALCSAWYLDSE